MPTLQDLLVDTLKAHGLNAFAHQDWVVVDGNFPALSAVFVNERQLEHGASVQLDVRVLLAGGQQMIESFGGGGSDGSEARANAFEGFCRGSLHVLMAAFWNQVDEDQVAVEFWELGGTMWRAVIGNFITKGQDGRQPQIPQELFPTIEHHIKQLSPAEDTLWVRTYFCNVGSAPTVTEVLLNNQHWLETEAAIAGLPWEAAPYFYSVRNFLILQKT